jgi:hypothetical protein
MQAPSENSLIPPAAVERTELTQVATSLQLRWTAQPHFAMQLE